MRSLQSFVVLAGVALVVGLVACSSDDSSSNGASCSQAKSISDSCNAAPKDGGSSGLTVTFDQGKCESGGDAAKKVADCIVANKSNCDCTLKCAVTGGTC